LIVVLVLVAVEAVALIASDGVVARTSAAADERIFDALVNVLAAAENNATAREGSCLCEAIFALANE
jgi:hypothetical protein